MTSRRPPPPALIAQPFEAAFLGGPCWRLNLPPEGCEPEALAGFLRDVEAAEVALLTCRIDAGRNDLASVLEAAGLRRVERLLTLARPLEEQGPPAGTPGVTVEAGGPGDRAACGQLARVAFTSDRFHADPTIPDPAADALKARWAENALTGRADAPLVARDPAGRVIGFNMCRFDPKTRQAAIDLIAVAAEARGRGVGRALVEAALRHYRGRAERLLVGTQADNAASLALYRASGFEVVAEQLTYHLTGGRLTCP